MVSLKNQVLQSHLVFDPYPWPFHGLSDPRCGLASKLSCENCWGLDFHSRVHDLPTGGGSEEKSKRENLKWAVIKTPVRLVVNSLDPTTCVRDMWSMVCESHAISESKLKTPVGWATSSTNDMNPEFVWNHLKSSWTWINLAPKISQWISPRWISRGFWGISLP